MVVEMLATLRDAGYRTVLLSVVFVDLKRAKDQFGVDLHDISVVLVPDVPDHDLGDYTKNTDVFINASFLDFIPSQANQSYLLTYFPTPFDGLKENIKHSVISILQKAFVFPNKQIGIKGNGVLEKNSVLTLNKPFSGVLAIKFHIPTLAFSVIDSFEFYAGSTKLLPKRRRVFTRTNIIEFEFDSNWNTRDVGLRLVIPESGYANDVTLTAISLSTLQYFAYRAFAFLFPTMEQRLHGGETGSKRSALETYTDILSISTFTSTWIQQYWNKPSKLLYPPTDTTAFTPAKNKKQQIVHIGRFFVGAHSKKQLELVSAFRDLIKTGVTGWQLHLVGSVGQEYQHQEYFKQVLHASEGLPIQFHTDITRSEVQKLLSESSLYWHATGLHSSGDPLLAEHFGISVVEAMASGMVPIVYNQGGPVEIVTKESGFLFNTQQELCSHTHKLINDGELRERMQKAARERSSIFSTTAFRKTFLSYVQNS